MSGGAGATRPPEWGPFTPLRDVLARSILGAEAPPPRAARFRCVILKLDALGDFVLATGAIARLVAHFGAERCALVVSPAAAELARREFPAVHQVVLPAHVPRLWRGIVPQQRAWRQALAELASEDVVALRHQRSLYRDLILRAIPAHRRWWVDGAPFSDRAILPLPRSDVRYPTAADAPRELAAHAALLSAALGTALKPAEILPRLAAVRPALPALVLAPCAQNPRRDLPAATVGSALASLPPQRADRPLRVIGGPGQRERLARFLADLPEPWRSRGEIVCGAPLEEWLAQLAGAELVIAAESATAHLAAALDRPLVALVGGGHPELFAPWQRSARQRWLRHWVPCYGCDWQCPYPAPLCLTEIAAPAIATAITEVCTPAA